MKHLKTEIIINAPAEKVWGILFDTSAYPDWNPFIVSVNKNFKPGEKMNIVLQQPDSKPMTIKPVVLEVIENKKLRWLGHLGFKGLFDGHHIFELEAQSVNKTRFIHREEFSGILVGLLWKQLNTKTRKGFELMNQSLKALSERS